MYNIKTIFIYFFVLFLIIKNIYITKKINTQDTQLVYCFPVDFTFENSRSTRLLHCTQLYILRREGYNGNLHTSVWVEAPGFGIPWHRHVLSLSHPPKAFAAQPSSCFWCHSIEKLLMPLHQGLRPFFGGRHLEE